jgi:hypothetical protein
MATTQSRDLRAVRDAPLGLRRAARADVGYARGWQTPESIVSTTEASETEATGGAEVARRKGPPRWGIVAFLGLFAGVVVMNQFLTTSGPAVAWIENDLDAALQRAAAEKKPRIFLYLYEPNDPTHTRNERNVFSQRWAREPLQHVVCCRIALRPGDLARLKYEYKNTPLFLLLDAQGKPVQGMRTEGPVDEREFSTYIGGPINEVVKRGR